MIKLVSVGAIRRFIFIFFANQNFSRHRAATQMDRSSASSKILFHGLPSKSKRPSIRKHSVLVIITVNSVSFYETAIFREILENSSSASKYVPKRFRVVKLQAFTGATTGCVLKEMCS